MNVSCVDENSTLISVFAGSKGIITIHINQCGRMARFHQAFSDYMTIERAICSDDNGIWQINE